MPEIFEDHQYLVWFTSYRKDEDDVEGYTAGTDVSRIH
jgi:hypothetical protein